MDKDPEITDFSRSYVRWRIDTTQRAALTVSRPLPMTLNNVRAPVDARVVLTEQATGMTREYVLTVSCQAEQVWVERDVWHNPPADMCMIASRDECLIIKRWDKAEKGVLRHPPTLGIQPERQLDNPAICFDRFGIDRMTRPGHRLETIDAIVEALSSTTSVVAHTEYVMGGFHVMLEYPVKIVNFSEREWYYQVDTGPMLLPDLVAGVNPSIQAMQLAFVAHTGQNWAEFLVCTPTPLAPDIKVHHYSCVVRLEEVTNYLFALEMQIARNPADKRSGGHGESQATSQ